jgi:hypothetical protein
MTVKHKPSNSNWIQWLTREYAERVTPSLPSKPLIIERSTAQTQAHPLSCLFFSGIHIRV